MSGASIKRGRNAPPPRPVVIKRVHAPPHAAHHGGAWKVAYADFVTAMMAFFLLMWLLGATTEKQRKSIADYFAPTLIEKKQGAAGGDGLLQGDSVLASADAPHAMNSAPRAQDRQRFADLQRALRARLEARGDLRRLARNVRFTETREGLRIDIVDEADFAMFEVATDRLLPAARGLVEEVAHVAADVPNPLIVRGHTDALPYAATAVMNNWLLSTARAEATRAALSAAGLAPPRFARIEGVADREPYNPADRLDPRNRRMSITLAWTGGA